MVYILHNIARSSSLTETTDDEPKSDFITKLKRILTYYRCIKDSCGVACIARRTPNVHICIGIYERKKRLVNNRSVIPSTWF